MSAYIMVTRADRFWLVGPFGDEHKATLWANPLYGKSAGNSPNNPEDDPRWQVLTLANFDGTAPLRSPGDGPMESP